MNALDRSDLLAALRAIPRFRHVGHVQSVDGSVIRANGLTKQARQGDRVTLRRRDLPDLNGSVIALQPNDILLMMDQPCTGVSVGDDVLLDGPLGIMVNDHWMGRILDPFGRAMDGRPVMPSAATPLDRAAPIATTRRGFGGRLRTSSVAFNTFLPLVQGQRIGIFAGSGVGKTTLLGQLAQSAEADVTIIALVGERGRELRHFTEHVLGPEAMKRCIVIAATSDQSPMMRHRCAYTAITAAEYFRDKGQQVLLVLDSITRFAEAQRDIAVTTGSQVGPTGFPPTTALEISALCERLGSGSGQQGDITAVLSVLVEGSDLDGPVADMLRGILDGHVVLSRDIAERGRFPAIDLAKSVSRSLPAAASASENALLQRARALIGRYHKSEAMVRAGLYAAGSDPELDIAIAAWDGLDHLMSQTEPGGIKDSFTKLELILKRAGAMTQQPTQSAKSQAGLTG